MKYITILLWKNKVTAHLKHGETENVLTRQDCC